MHIVHLSPYYVPAYAFGGVVRAVEGMATALVRRGHTVTVLTTDVLDADNRYEGALNETLDGVRVVRVPNVVQRFANLSTPRKMPAVARDLLQDADVLHCHEFRTFENVAVIPIAAEMQVPVFLSPHGTLSYETGRSQLKLLWDSVLSPRVAPRVPHIIGLTGDEVADAQSLWQTLNGGHTPSFSVVPNGVNPEAFVDLPDGALLRQRYNLGDGVVCLFMGRLHKRKGVRVLVEAFRAANVPQSRLLIVGPDEGEKAKITPRLSDDIVLTGFLGGADRLAALAAADVLVLPAIGEGLPMVVLEAMAASLPVIISPECHLPQVQRQNAGMVVQPSLQELTEALRFMLTDAEARRRYGENARRLVESRFSWDVVAEQLEAVYLKYAG